MKLKKIITYNNNKYEIIMKHKIHWGDEFVDTWSSYFFKIKTLINNKKKKVYDIQIIPKNNSDLTYIDYFKQAFGEYLISKNTTTVKNQELIDFENWDGVISYAEDNND